MTEGARTEHEDPTSYPFAPYVPRIAADWLANADAPLYQEVSASVVFIDISGFTRLSEHLARRGRIGAGGAGGRHRELLCRTAHRGLRVGR